jgi:hypothetical protein
VAAFVSTVVQTGNVGLAIKAGVFAGLTSYAISGFSEYALVPVIQESGFVDAPTYAFASVAQGGYSAAQSIRKGDILSGVLSALVLAGGLAASAEQAIGQRAGTGETYDRADGVSGDANAAGSGDSHTDHEQEYELYVGAKFTDTDARAGKVGIGHSYVGLREPGGQIQTYGFYPIAGARFEGLEALRSVKGEVRPDVDLFYLERALAGESGYSVVRYSIGRAQYLSALDAVQRYQTQSYNAVFCNCTHFAVDVANAAGVRVPFAGIISRPAVFEPSLHRHEGQTR